MITTNYSCRIIPPFFLDCVVAIGYPSDTGDTNWGASGFFYGKRQDSPEVPDKRGYRIYLVTNRHVVEGTDKILIRVNPAAAKSARQFDASLIDPVSGVRLWFGHGSAQVDVAVIPINYQMMLDQQMQLGFFASDEHAQDVQAMDAEGVSEGDSVFVLGFPMGLVGEKRNTVIVRGGVLARVRDVIAEPTLPFMVDTTVFPGNSGGPIVSRPEAIAIRGTRNRPNANLIGIVCGYVPYIDVAISQQTNRPRVTFEENSGLAVAHSVDCINQVIDQFEGTPVGQTQLQAQPGRLQIIEDSGEPTAPAEETNR